MATHSLDMSSVGKFLSTEGRSVFDLVGGKKRA